MNIVNILVYAIFGGIINYASVYCWNILLNQKINWKNYKIYLSLIVLTVIGTTINFVAPQYLKILFMTLLYFAINYLLFCREIEKSILTVLIAQFIMMISELLFAIVGSFFYNDIGSLQNYAFGIFLINSGIAIFAFLILATPIPKMFYNLLLKVVDNVKKDRLFLMFLLTIILASLLMIISWVQLPRIAVLIINTILVLVYLVVIIILIYTQEKFRKISSKYETSLSSLREYEEIMDRYRVINHESKNQLLTIRNMVKASDDKTINYIDKIIENKIKDNEKIFNKTSKIPEGGLRAIIYSKILKMDELNLNYKLNIANDIKTVDLINLDDETILNICKIIGVFLDNAIEAVCSFAKNNIIVEIFILDEYLCIDISNNYFGNLEVDKLGNKGYSTKGKGHGYGLALVNKIIRNDSNLKHETSINKKLFTQRLKIKM